MKAQLTREGVLEWMRTLRVPPFEAAYVVQPRGHGCRTNAKDGAQSTLFTDAISPGGARSKCRTCDDVWLPAWHQRRPKPSSR